VHGLELSTPFDQSHFATEASSHPTSIPSINVQRKSEAPDPLRAATVAALKQIADSLLEVMFDAGITVQQLNYVMRERAVQAARKRVLKDTGRVSNSRVAIITGLSRSEVARIARSPDEYTKSKRGQNPAWRLLAAWFNDARYLTPDGAPATLPIFSKNRSFESLVGVHGAGLPVRAMLDELILQTLAKNMERSASPLFEATSLVLDANPKLVPITRREIEKQATSFISSSSSLLSRSRQRDLAGSARRPAKCRVGVTVYYFESVINQKEGKDKIESARPRRNLRRRRNQV
jgi:hypothetical protein